MYISLECSIEKHQGIFKYLLRIYWRVRNKQRPSQIWVDTWNYPQTWAIV